MSIAEIKTLAAAFDDGTLTVDAQLELLRGKLTRLDRRVRELNTTRTAIAAKIAALESISGSAGQPATRHGSAARRAGTPGA